MVRLIQMRITEGRVRGTWCCMVWRCVGCWLRRARCLPSRIRGWRMRISIILRWLLTWASLCRCRSVDVVLVVRLLHNILRRSGIGVMRSGGRHSAVASGRMASQRAIVVRHAYLVTIHCLLLPCVAVRWVSIIDAGGSRTAIIPDPARAALVVVRLSMLRMLP